VVNTPALHCIKESKAKSKKTKNKKQKQKFSTTGAAGGLGGRVISSTYQVLSE
jgi:hypothetical protein